MHCPRCGSPNEPGDRYCAACGAHLKRAVSAEQEPAGHGRFAKILGGDRRTRTISALTIAALAVAVVGFIALDPSDEDSIPRDRYTLAAEQICLKSKRSIATSAGGSGYARELVPIVVAWREQLAELQPPADRQEQSRRLDEALREVEIETAALARLIEAGDRGQILASAKRADAATAEVEQAIDGLGLSQCAEVTIGVSRAE